MYLEIIRPLMGLRLLLYLEWWVLNMFDLEDPLWMEVEIEVHRSFGVVF
jgi:hypothetical protein